jgi:hypothetical protein
MPIEVTRIEEGIYHYQWLGNVTVEEGRDAGIRGAAMADKLGENPHIQILDAENVKKLPVDIRGLGGVGAEQAGVSIQILVIHAPAIGRIIVNTLKSLVPFLRNMEFCTDMDEALAKARTTLSEYKASLDS